MEIKEAAADRVVIAKPVASKPTCSAYRSFSELLAGAINDSSPPRDPAVAAAIRPKTVRVAKPTPTPAAQPPPSVSQSRAEVSRAAAPGPGQSLDTLLATDTKTSVVYKPLAKVVSKSTVSLLANMGNFDKSPQPSQVEPRPQQLLRPQGWYLRSNQGPQSGTSSQPEPSRLPETSRGQPSSQNTEEDENSVIPAVANVDRPSYDGYNWRKYGQKQVKGSEYPRSYYKCTHPNCPVKKKVERSFDGHIAEIVYKGEHNHAKPQPPKKNTPAAAAQANGSEGTGQDFGANINSSQYLNDARHEASDIRLENQNETLRSSAIPAYHASNPALSFDNVANAGLGTPENSCGVSGEHEELSKGIDADEEEPKSKRRKSEVQPIDPAGPSGHTMQVPKIVVQSSTDNEIVGDGYRWRKYGQKVVKGNPYPRSYYRCTSLKCNVRKHVERASEDPGSFITTYEGKHNHEMPARADTQAASEQGSQSQASKDIK
uniref:WRKY domain-containing protein n=1 Tax=Kalanchoe fedtschenkoi TaxID=63787 RepID=A0A7N0VDR5_KALFE